jgi:hypothetical protein
LHFPRVTSRLKLPPFAAPKQLGFSQWPIPLCVTSSTVADVHRPRFREHVAFVCPRPRLSGSAAPSKSLRWRRQHAKHRDPLPLLHIVIATSIGLGRSPLGGRRVLDVYCGNPPVGGGGDVPSSLRIRDGRCPRKMLFLSGRLTGGIQRELPMSAELVPITISFRLCRCLLGSSSPRVALGVSRNWTVLDPQRPELCSADSCDRESAARHVVGQQIHVRWPELDFWRGLRICYC